MSNIRPGPATALQPPCLRTSLPGLYNHFILSSIGSLRSKGDSDTHEMHRRHVALVGVNSRIGPAILDALLASSSSYQIYLLLRPNSHPPPITSKRITIITLPDPASIEDIVSAFQEHAIEYLVSALSPAQLDLQKKLADACVVPGVGIRRYVLADYGSCRSDDPYILDLLPNFRKKREVREHCMRLVEDYTHHGQGHGSASAEKCDFSWTTILTGHFFDYGLSTELLGFDIPKREGILFDKGQDHWSASTTAQIGRAVVGVFDNLESTSNRVISIQSFRITQSQVLEHVNEVLREAGKKQVVVEEVSARAFVRDRIEGAGRGEEDATEEMVAVLGITRSDWKHDPGFANRRLGLQEEDLREVIKKKLAEMGEI